MKTMFSVHGFDKWFLGQFVDCLFHCVMQVGWSLPPIRLACLFVVNVPTYMPLLGSVLVNSNL